MKDNNVPKCVSDLLDYAVNEYTDNHYKYKNINLIFFFKLHSNS